jgi:hypothetical protein
MRPDLKTEEKHTSPEEYKGKNEVDGVEVPRKSGEGTMNLLRLPNLIMNPEW